MRAFIEPHDTDVSTAITDDIDCNTHLHNNIELIYVKKGSANLNLDNINYKLNAGDFAVVFPNQLHSYCNSQDVFAYVLVFSQNILGELQRVTHQYLPLYPIVCNAPAETSQLLDIYFSLYSHTPTSLLDGILCSVCGLLFDEMDFFKTRNCDMSTLKSLLVYCDEHYADSITIDTVAQALHISRSHISHLFRNKLNTTFTAYISKARIKHACRMLSDGNSVADTALASGFGSIRTFNRTFNAIMGMPPSAYKSKR